MLGISKNCQFTRLLSNAHYSSVVPATHGRMGMQISLTKVIYFFESARKYLIFLINISKFHVLINLLYIRKRSTFSETDKLEDFGCSVLGIEQQKGMVRMVKSGYMCLHKEGHSLSPYGVAEWPSAVRLLYDLSEFMEPILGGRFDRCSGSSCSSPRSPNRRTGSRRSPSTTGAARTTNIGRPIRHCRGRSRGGSPPQARR